MEYIMNASVEKVLTLGDNKIDRGRKIRHIMSEIDDTEHSLAEYNSWEHSLPELLEILKNANLTNVNVVFEYNTPVGGRIDALVIGYNHQNKPTVLIVELKQWGSIAENINNSQTEVRLNLGTNYEYRIHPVQQLLTYRKSLTQHHQFCENDDFQVEEIAYLHNFVNKNDLFDGNYSDYKNYYYEKVYTSSDKDKLVRKLRQTFQNKESSDLAKKFLSGSYVLGKAGYEGIKDIINNKENAVMIEDQIEINKQIFKELEDFQNDNQSRLIIIKGGPGTGKTILGLHILYAYLNKFSETRMDALFTFATSRTLKQIIEGEANGQVPLLSEHNVKDKALIIIDEAHRFLDVDNKLKDYFNSGKKKFIVVLQDDRQRIRIKENGTFRNFEEFGIDNSIRTKTFELKVQKRSGVFGDYVDLIDSFFYGNTLVSNPNINFDIQIESKLHTIDTWLHKKRSEGYTGKWYAGFCWPWSRDVRVNDIKINNQGTIFEKPWNPMNQQYSWYKNKEHDSLDQIGCIYTAQGLDYDYTGVIWGKDLRWDKNKQTWIIDLAENKDYSFVNQFTSTDSSEERVELLINTYRVLLTRALKGTRVWFADKDTEEHFKTYFKIQNN